MNEYFNEKLTWNEDGELLDSAGNFVMMEWERSIMKAQAKTVTSKGGRVLNIGFGMGIIDNYISQENIDEHWIIEGHPDVISKMKEDGWDKKATCVFSSWQEAFYNLPKFDGIYFDTWNEGTSFFLRVAKDLLKEDGVLSFFNRPKTETDKELKIEEINLNSIKNWADVEFESFDIGIDIPEHQRNDGKKYWKPSEKTYHNPIITHKKNI